MKFSTDRILTTHVGSLPRPPELLALLEARETSREFDQAAFEKRLAGAVREIVAKQVAVGTDSVCDGELGKISYTTYIRHRFSGIGLFRGGDNDKPPQSAAHRDLLDHPDYMQRLNETRRISWFSREAVPCCTGPVTYSDRLPLETDLKNLTAACATVKPVEAFMNAASPGVLTKFVPNRYYQDEDAYVDALANALKVEYEAIVKAGFILRSTHPISARPATTSTSIFPTRSSCALPSAISRHSIMRPPISRPKRCACISVGAITRGRTPTTSRWPRPLTSVCGRDRLACRSKRPIRGTRTSGRICALRKFPMTRS